MKILTPPPFDLVYQEYLVSTAHVDQCDLVGLITYAHSTIARKDCIFAQ